MNTQMQFWRNGLAVAGMVLSFMLPAGPALAQGATFQRPITDFTSTQGKYCAPVGSADCAMLFNTLDPIPFLIWTENTPKGSSSGPIWCAVVDYAGLFAKPGFGTAFKGTVTERPLNNGTSQAEVTVILDTSNALTWVFAGTSTPNDCGPNFDAQALLFGTRPANVAASGANAALGDAHFKVVFINTALGAPLPDVLQLAYSPAPGQALQQISISASANGPLRAAFGVPDGTPGRAHVLQTGLFFMTGGHGATSDNFPAEMVNLVKTGK